MTNRAKAKGTFAENCVRDHLRARYPDREANGAGHLWNRVGMGGVKDEGDILGPHTSIEVKNYSNPPESMLLSNAERKGIESGMRYWMLVYKAKGKGLKSVGEWHAMTTVASLVDPRGWGLLPDGFASPEDFLEALPGLCSSSVDVSASFTTPAFGESFPEREWTADLLCRPFKAKRELRRRETMSSHRVLTAIPETRRTPFILSPRNEPGSERDPKDWYAYATFDDFINALEAVGVIPQGEPADLGIFA